MLACLKACVPALRLPPPLLACWQHTERTSSAGLLAHALPCVICLINEPVIITCHLPPAVPLLQNLEKLGYKPEQCIQF